MKEKKKERGREILALSVKMAGCFSKEWGHCVGNRRREESVGKPPCSLGRKDQQVKGNERKSQRSRTATDGVVGVEKWVTVTVRGGHTCFSLDVMGPQGVVTWVCKPRFLPTLSPSPCMTQWRPLLCTTGCPFGAVPDTSLSSRH